MLSILSLALTIAPLAVATPIGAPPGFGNKDTVLSSPPGVEYWDPEFTVTPDGAGLVTWTDPDRAIWVAEIDQRSGIFIADGIGASPIDGGAALLFEDTGQGPEFIASRLGIGIAYTTIAPDGSNRTAIAPIGDGTPSLVPVPHGVRSTGALPREDPTADRPLLVHYESAGPATGAFVRGAGGERGPLLEGLSGLGPRWFPAEPLIAYIADVAAPGEPRRPEVAIIDAETGDRLVVTNDGVDKLLAHPYRAPELNDRLAVMVLARDNTELRLYAAPEAGPASGPWEVYAVLTTPGGADDRFLFSPEPVQGQRGVAGFSYFVAAGYSEGDPPFVPAGSIWMFAVGPQPGGVWTRAWRLDEGAVTGAIEPRAEPETHVGEHEVLVYYTVQRSDRPLRLETRLARPGIPTDPTDLDTDGTVDFFDVLAQLSAQDAGSPFADADRSGVVDPGDTLTFLRRVEDAGGD